MSTLLNAPLCTRELHASTRLPSTAASSTGRAARTPRARAITEHQRQHRDGHGLEQIVAPVPEPRAGHPGMGRGQREQVIGRPAVCAQGKQQAAAHRHRAEGREALQAPRPAQAPRPRQDDRRGHEQHALLREERGREQQAGRDVVPLAREQHPHAEEHEEERQRVDARQIEERARCDRRAPRRGRPRPARPAGCACAHGPGPRSARARPARPRTKPFAATADAARTGTRRAPRRSSRAARRCTA